MNKSAIFGLFLGGVFAFGQDSTIPSGPVITERGPHHRVWEYYTTTTNSYQEVSVVTNNYTEIQTGINYWNGTTWIESSENIEAFSNGAVARHGQHQVVFSPQFNVSGVIDLLTSDGQRVRGTPVGLAYHDDATGKAVLIASLKDSLGELLPPNQVIYPDCFSNLTVDIRYTYTKAGFEQDVILRENPPAPEEYGLDSATTRLEVWTEFQGSSTPQISSKVAWQTPLTPSGRKMADPDTIDDTLQFGSMMTGPGKAFALDSDKMDGTELIPVAKRWQKVQGKTYLVESVFFTTVQASLQALPAAGAPQGASLRGHPADHLDLPATHPQLAKTAPIPIASHEVQAFYRHSFPSERTQNRKQLASNTKAISNHGFVLDYTLLNAATNFTFRGDTTYYVSSSVYLQGNTTIEGGTVVKYATNISALVQFTDTITCQATAYRPAIFTAVDDDSVGEIISGSTGMPTIGKYGGVGMLDFSSMNVDLSNLRFCFARQALYFYNCIGASVRHSQFVKCGNGSVEYNTMCNWRNVLFQQSSNAFYGAYYTNNCEHITFSECSYTATENTLGSSSVKLTNSILVQITNASTVATTTSFCASATSTNGVLQMVGAGKCYLATNSWRGAGTTAINTSLLNDLANKTTYPPLILTNAFTANTVLTPIVPRNTGSPDLGYHYDPIDYAFSGNVLNSATLILTNGVAIVVFGTTGIELQTGANIYSMGTPLNLNRIVRYQAVQEQPMQWGTSNSTVSLMNVAATYDGLPSLNFRFTDFSLLAASVYKRYVVNVNTYSMVTNLSFSDCQIRGGYLYFLPYYYDPRTMTLAATNNLIERSAWSMTQGYSSSATAFAVKFYNNLFRLSTITLVDTVNNVNWYIYDNLFDQTTLSSSGTYPVNANNGYYSTTTLPGGSGNVIPTFPLYQNSSLDRPYYLTNTSTLINAGSRLASAAGLYHYTVLTNQTKEASSQVDIGMHYVALNNGVPVDTDNDGLPDYFEDRNGNGVTDSGETDMNNPDSDNDGCTDGQEVLAGTNPLDGANCTPIRLGYWKFNGTSLNGEQGQIPLSNNGVVLVSGFDGNAAQLTNTGAILKYRNVELNGNVNMVCSNMSIRFMFKPLWQYNYTNQPTVKRLWEFGNPDVGSGMALSIDLTGTIIFKSSDGLGSVFVATNNNALMDSNSWHEIQLSVSRHKWDTNSSCSVWLDGITKIYNATPSFPFPFPNATVRSSGFCIGCSSDGTKQAGGCFDNFESFNYETGEVGALFVNNIINAEPSPDQSQIVLKWRSGSSKAMDIRRFVSGTNWTTLTTTTTTHSYTDSPPQIGQKYLYGRFVANTNIMYDSIISGIKLPPVENRGRVLLMVEGALAPYITTNLVQYQQDLVGDGWTVSVITNAPSQDNLGWRNGSATNLTYIANCLWVKNAISNSYNLSNDLKSVVLIGHVTVPYSGDFQEDNHPDHEGAWPADGFYGDFSSVVWTDSNAYTNTINSVQQNLPGDGKYDPLVFPSPLKVYIGRIDFNSINAFTNMDDVALTKRYLDKNHRYRFGQTVLPNRAISGTYFAATPDQNNFQNCLTNRSYGFESNIIGGDLFLDNIPCQWGFQCGSGNPIGISQDGTNHYHGIYELNTNEPPINFYGLYGSYFGDWNYTGPDNNWTGNNFMRGVLGTPNYGLASFWDHGVRNWSAITLGGTLGDTLLDSINSNSTNYSCRTTYLMGDPTLRTFVTRPVTSLTASGNVTLSWNWYGDSNAQFLIWRTTNLLFNSPTNFAKLTTNPIASTMYSDSSAPAGNKVYMVRVLNLVSSASGSYTNMSQGVFITVP